MANERQSRVIERPSGRRSGRRRRRQERRMLTLVVASVVIFLLALGAKALFTPAGEPVAADNTAEPTPSPTPSAPAPTPTPEPELTYEDKLAMIEEDLSYPRDMLEFAQKYPQVVDYVLAYPEKKDLDYEIDLSAEAAAGEIPDLLQWDERWGYEPYGSGLIGYTGCGPVSLSMVAIGLTGDSKWDPLTVAKFAAENGYSVPGSGTAWTLISEGSKQLGLMPKELPLSEGVMKNHLREGHPIIIVVGPGDFTFSGHYLVITGYDDTGFQIHDPNNPENTKKTWTYERLSPQIRNLWAMSADIAA